MFHSVHRAWEGPDITPAHKHVHTQSRRPPLTPITPNFPQPLLTPHPVKQIERTFASY